MLKEDKQHFLKTKNMETSSVKYRPVHAVTTAAETGGTASTSDSEVPILGWDWELSSTHDMDLLPGNDPTAFPGFHQASASSSGSSSGSGSSSSDSGEDARKEMAANARKRRLKRCCCIFFVLVIITFIILLAIPCTRQKLFGCCCGKKKEKHSKKKKKKGGDDDDSFLEMVPDLPSLLQLDNYWTGEYNIGTDGGES